MKTNLMGLSVPKKKALITAICTRYGLPKPINTYGRDGLLLWYENTPISPRSRTIIERISKAKEVTNIRKETK